MKNTKKLPHVYKASNVEFDANGMDATSYGWWYFVRRIEGQIVFNWYMYSNSTRKHQHKTRALMSELGINIDRTTNIRGSLSRYSTLAQLTQAEKEQREFDLSQAEEKRLEKNRRARERRSEQKRNRAASLPGSFAVKLSSISPQQEHQSAVVVPIQFASRRS